MEKLEQFPISVRLLIPLLLITFFNHVRDVDASSKSYGKRSVSTPFGVVRGETIIPISEEDLPAVTQYLGIPYGVAPTGQYRFNMAISAPKWTHQPKDAFRYSSVCIQSGLPNLSETEALKSTSSQRFDQIHRIFPHLKPQSEDCLYMNLYVPERMERRNGENPTLSGSQLSVMVIVHGGEYGWGAGSAYNASVLAAYGQILVVTLNYRLGVYGFLSRCESNSCQGNAGLSDLVAALKMLSNILPAFGADLSSLTLLGWGSGASLVSLLMASPITKPKNRLFKRAILLDGSALCPWALVDHSQEYFFRIANELQCTDLGKNSSEKIKFNEDHFLKKISQIVRCIQDHNQQNLTLAARKILVPSFLSAFTPIVDGQIVPNHPKFSFSPKYGTLFRDIDLMLGTVSYPAHHLMSNADIENGIEVDRRDKILRTLVRNLFNYHRTEIFNAILSEYTDWDNPKNHPKTIRNNLLATLSDVLFTSPLIETARMHATDEVTPKISNTYFFLFAHETKAWTQEQPYSGIRGSLSDEHLPYILGYPLVSTQKDSASQIYSGFTNDDKGISRVLMQYISNFVKSGNPLKPVSISTQSTIEDRFHGTPWPQFSPETREAYLEISDRPRVKNYYRNSFVGFWNSFIPTLNKGTRESGVPDEHHFLPNNFNKNSFYGVVRPLHSYHNDPFPPPPMPPTPFPRDVKKPVASGAGGQTAAPPTAQNSANEQPSSTTKQKLQTSEYFPISFSLTVAVGVGFFVLNICLYVIISQKCIEKRKSTKHLKYQSYATGLPSTSDINYNVSNSMLGIHQLPPPPPMLSSVANLNNTVVASSPPTNLSSNEPSKTNSPAVTSRRSHNFSFDAGMRPTSLIHHQQNYGQNPAQLHILSGLSTSIGGSAKGGAFVTALHSTHYQQHQSQSSSNGEMVGNQHQHNVALRSGSLNEQEPLLSNSKSSTPAGMIRPGISATCPRHGRAAQMMVAAASMGGRVDSIGSGGYALTTSTLSQPAHKLEEAQV